MLNPWLLALNYRTCSCCYLASTLGIFALRGGLMHVNTRRDHMTGNNVPELYSLNFTLVRRYSNTIWLYSLPIAVSYRIRHCLLDPVTYLQISTVSIQRNRLRQAQHKSTYPCNYFGLSLQNNEAPAFV